MSIEKGDYVKPVYNPVGDRNLKPSSEARDVLNYDGKTVYVGNEWLDGGFFHAIRFDGGKWDGKYAYLDIDFFKLEPVEDVFYNMIKELANWTPRDMRYNFPRRDVKKVLSDKLPEKEIFDVRAWSVGIEEDVDYCLVMTVKPEFLSYKEFRVLEEIDCVDSIHVMYEDGFDISLNIG